MKNAHTISGLGVSLLLHAVFLGLLVGLGQLPPSIESELLIDLTITNDSGAAAAPATTPGRAEGAQSLNSPAAKMPLSARMAEQRLPTRSGDQPSEILPETPTTEKIAVAEAIQPITAPASHSFSAEALMEPQKAGGTVTEGVAPVVAKSELAARGTGMPKGEAAGGSGAMSSLPQSVQEDPRVEYLKAHFEYIKNEIQQKIVYPLVARKNGWQGRVVVSFMVCEDGRVEAISIRESSGFSLLDKSAVKTIQQAAPFPPPPSRAVLLVPINFSLV